ncbi:GntR family transcriptional regulator [Arhodomonas aquaeolei]|uniref:GntR family transcriptional regulator n=1 Tax=Arhodomonas aquaeolei TaxID=2369 RepID=UPI0021690E4B|nr:GntR family transcriptional regulator [Arhodomonas aquaeolei]MCS4505067.1 GntR family transcriptional regulator [Arhodomonas aquaeolei]
MAMESNAATRAERTPRNRDDTIHRALSETIVDHRLAPGARLPEDALAEAFEVSRTSIRKALQRLALEHLVTLRTNRGAQVAKPSPDEAREVFAARRLAECALVDWVVDALGDDDLTALHELVDRERRAQADGAQHEAIQLSAAFHIRLARVAHNAPFATFIEQLARRSSLVIAVYGSASSVGCECGDHGEILALLAGGERERARQWMTRHLEGIERSLNFDGERRETPDFNALFGRHGPTQTASEE